MCRHDAADGGVVHVVRRRAGGAGWLWVSCEYVLWPFFSYFLFVFHVITITWLYYNTRLEAGRCRLSCARLLVRGGLSIASSLFSFQQGCCPFSTCDTPRRFQSSSRRAAPSRVPYIVHATVSICIIMFVFFTSPIMTSLGCEMVEKHTTIIIHRVSHCTPPSPPPPLPRLLDLLLLLLLNCSTVRVVTPHASVGFNT